MKTRIGLLMLVISGMLASCGSAPKTLVGSSESMVLDKLVEEMTFRIESDWARPLATNSMNQVSNAGLLPAGSTASRINLIGNSNYLDVKGDKITAYLPYYGEQQMSVAYNRIDQGIVFDGTPKDFSLEKNKDQTAYEMKFRINEVTEEYRVSVLLFPNMKSVITVFSSHRFPIRYEGEIERIKDEPLAKVQP